MYGSKFSREHKILELLYEEAKYNILTGRYPCEISDYIMLGGIQARLELGPCDIGVHTPSYMKTVLFRWNLKKKHVALILSSEIVKNDISTLTTVCCRFFDNIYLWYWLFQIFARACQLEFKLVFMFVMEKRQCKELSRS